MPIGGMNNFNRVNFNTPARPALHLGNEDALKNSGGGAIDGIKDKIGETAGKILDSLVEGSWKSLAISIAMIAVSLFAMFGFPGLEIGGNVIIPKIDSIIGHLNSNFTDVGVGSLMPIGAMGALVGVGAFGVYSFVLSRFGKRGQQLKDQIGSSPDGSKGMGALCGLALTVVGAFMVGYAGGGGVNWGANATIYGGFALMGFGLALFCVRAYEFYATRRISHLPPPEAEMVAQEKRAINRASASHGTRQSTTN